MRMIPEDYDEFDKTYEYYKEAIETSVERLQNKYQGRYAIYVFLNSKGFMTMISNYYDGEKFVIGSTIGGKTIYTPKITKSQRKNIDENYKLYKVIPNNN